MRLSAENVNWSFLSSLPTDFDDYPPNAGGVVVVEPPPIVTELFFTSPPPLLIAMPLRFVSTAGDAEDATFYLLPEGGS